MITKPCTVVLQRYVARLWQALIMLRHDFKERKCSVIKGIFNNCLSKSWSKKFLTQ